MNEQQLIEQRQRQLAEVYDPQEQFIQQQKAALPGMFEGQRSSLEQAKVNAFRDIGNTAQRRGMFFSGFQPAEQARYIGERFLPGMQDITARQEQARLGLLEQLIGLRGQRAGEMTKFQEQLRQEALQRQRDQEAFQRQQALQREQLSAQRAADQGKGFSVSYKDGGAGYMFTGPNKQPVSMAIYAQATGTPMVELLRQSPSSYDKRAYNAIVALQKGGQWNENQIENYIRDKFPLLF
jgi:hypothetical protein